MKAIKRIGVFTSGGDCSGLNAVIKSWLANNCKESPEEIRDIIVNEYKNKGN